MCPLYFFDLSRSGNQKVLCPINNFEHVLSLYPLLVYLFINLLTYLLMAFLLRCRKSIHYRLRALEKQHRDSSKRIKIHRFIWFILTMIIEFMFQQNYNPLFFNYVQD